MEVQLGIAVKVPLLKLEQYFTGKIGGEPIWLYEDSTVPNCCSNEMSFIIQVYCPMPFVQSYHRYLYVFICQDCRRVQVLRQQVSQSNQEVEQSSNDMFNDAAMSAEDLMSMLDNQGDQKIEEKVDWGLEVESEPYQITSAVEMLFGMNTTNEEEIIELESILYQGQGRDEQNDSDEDDTDDLEMLAKHFEQRIDKDISFDVYKFSAQQTPRQCIRYQPSGKPLWYSDKNRPQIQLQSCVCGCERVFEMQVMTQVLNFVDLGDIEFGSIYIYTCRDSCQRSTQEEAFIQELI